MTLSVIYLEFNAHLTSMATTAFSSDIPSGLRLLRLSFVFQQDNDQHTSRLRKGYLTKKESDGVLHQPPQSPDHIPIEIVKKMFFERVGV